MLSAFGVDHGEIAKSYNKLERRLQGLKSPEGQAYANARMAAGQPGQSLGAQPGRSIFPAKRAARKEWGTTVARAQGAKQSAAGKVVQAGMKSPGITQGLRNTENAGRGASWFGRLHPAGKAGVIGGAGLAAIGGAEMLSRSKQQ